MREFLRRGLLSGSKLLLLFATPVVVANLLALLMLDVGGFTGGRTICCCLLLRLVGCENAYKFYKSSFVLLRALLLPPWAGF